jgi:hypothetical protein
MSAVKDLRDRRVRVVESSNEVGGQVEAAEVSRLARLGRAWLAGWEAFAGVAGGRAEDLVGGNPWRSRELDDAAE